MMPVKEKIKTAHNGISIPFDAWDYTIETIKSLKRTQKNRRLFQKTKKLNLHRQTTRYL
jgi:hypothetical protein